MKILIQTGLLFGVYWLSQIIESLLPFSFPASVIGMILLLGLLGIKVIRLRQIREEADFLLGNLGFFFLPVSVGVLNYVDVIRENAAAFLTICMVSLVLTFAATSWTVQLLCRWIEKKKGDAA